MILGYSTVLLDCKICAMFYFGSNVLPVHCLMLGSHAHFEAQIVVVVRTVSLTAVKDASCKVKSAMPDLGQYCLKHSRVVDVVRYDKHTTLFADPNGRRGISSRSFWRFSTKSCSFTSSFSTSAYLVVFVVLLSDPSIPVALLASAM